MNEHTQGRYASHMQGIVQYAERLRDSTVDGRQMSDGEREDFETRIAALLTEAIRGRRAAA